MLALQPRFARPHTQIAYRIDSTQPEERPVAQRSRVCSLNPPAGRTLREQIDQERRPVLKIPGPEIYRRTDSQRSVVAGSEMLDRVVRFVLQTYARVARLFPVMQKVDRSARMPSSPKMNIEIHN